MNRIDLIKALPNGSFVLELGVAEGYFAEQIIQSGPVAGYVGVDRYGGDRGHDGAQYAAAHHRINNAPELGDIIYTRLLKCSFSDALINETLKKLRFAMIYVDGYAHTGQDAGQTLREWWPRVPIGGIFAGHDYDPQKWPETVAAVDAWAAAEGLEINLTDEQHEPSWWVRKV